MSLLSNLQQYIKEKQLFESKDSLLLAVSGGIDSMVLLDLLYHLGYRISVAHANFGLRGQDSQDDEAFVQKICQEYELPFFTKKFDTKAYMQTHKLSLQLAARQLRYDWFSELLEKSYFDYLLTAHHLNDQVETVIYNLSKGTGIAGFRGMRPKFGKIVRPLLFASRKEILEYAQNQGLSWREDISNESEKYSRNLIRHKVIPVLQQINPSLEHTFAHTMERMTEMEQWFESQMNLLEAQILQISEHIHYLNFGFLIQFSQANLILYHFLKKYNFTYAQSKEIFNALAGNNGKKFFSVSHSLVKQNERLIIVPKDDFDFENISIEANTSEITIKISSLKSTKITFEEKDAKNFQIIRQANVACLDRDKLSFPLQLRRWRAGDFFVPLGMKGRKKVSDLINEMGIMGELKKEVLVLCSAENIVWVFGLRVSEDFKVDKNTQKIYLVSYD